MSLSDNFRTRARLMRIALTRRFVYSDLIELVRDYGFEYHDLAADTEPFAFAASAGARPPGPGPDFGSIEPAERFTPGHAPGGFNSEPSVARFLGELAYRTDARTVIELGCFVGWTTAHLALALRARRSGGRIFAVDYQQEYLDLMRSNLARQGGLDAEVTALRGMSLEPAVLERLPPKADLVFLDTSHAYPATRDEILAYADRLAPGGHLVLHDSTSAPGVRRSIAELAASFRILTFATERSNGVTVLRPRA